MDRHQQIKERILWACRLINKAKSGSIEVLKESTIANVRSMERNSRSIKDPNPLMSTMTNINIKFPITFKSDKINIDTIPQQLFANTTDNRRKGRLLCKTDMVTWYIDNIEGNIAKDSAIEKLFESSVQNSKKCSNIHGRKSPLKLVMAPCQEH